MAPRLVVLVGFDGVQGLDLTGPLDVFAGARRSIERSGSRDRGYRVIVASPDGGPVCTTAGMTVLPEASLAGVAGRIDTLVVPGGEVTVDLASDQALVSG